MLSATSLAAAEVLAGREGLERPVERLNVMEVPDILPWVKPREFLLTTAYPLREDPERLPGLVAQLADRGLAGMGVKMGRYLDDLPSGLLDVADELAFPIVRLPDHVGFDDILNEVLTEILNRQASVLARSEETHRALLQIALSGGGWPEIARDLSELLESAVLLSDADRTVQAAAGLDGLKGALRDEGILEGTTVLATDIAAELDRSGPGAEVGRGSVRAIGAPIRAGARLHGRILTVEGARELDAGDVIALENAATVAALVVTKEAAVAAVESKYAADFLHDLIAGRVADETDVATRASALGWQLDRPLVTLVAAPEPSAPGPDDDLTERTAAALRTAVLPGDPGAAVVPLSGSVVVLAGAPDTADETRRLASTLASEGRENAGRPIGIGVSRPVDGALELATSYEQAERALRIGREIAGAGAVAHFDDLGADRLLSLIPDQEELRAFADEVLGPVAGEAPDDRELRRTLLVLLEEHLNVAASARRLHVHYNTLRYRIDKLERLLGPFTSDPRLRLDLQLGLRILPRFRLVPPRD
ncbi:PucR family transcriptional regulator [Egibacter rhizosphaerae]|uniref:PucR family transcriptional regulator n=1 Tax=Egibacter rhizosphaerae TaxID=1670831 RepID=UPI00197AB54F|nr:PucR family transcriptional regulator [Egibacter rhizosphaerae]